jgi:SPW repeat
MKGASWVNVVIGFWLIISPWAVGARGGAAMTEDVIVGVVIVAVALWSLSAPLTMTAPGWINLVLGIWMLIAPWAIGYVRFATGPATNDTIMGILVIVFAGIRIASGRQMAPAGTPPRY